MAEKYWVDTRPSFYVQTGGMHENPYGVPLAEILTMYDELGPEMGAQVVFGKYVDLSGLVFTADVLNQMFISTDEIPRITAERYLNKDAAVQSLIAQRSGRLDPYRYAIGVDLARKKDFTVITVLDCSTLPAHVVYWRRTNRVPWPVIYAEIGRAIHLFPGEFLIDETGIGDVIKEELENRMYCPAHHVVFEASGICPSGRHEEDEKRAMFRFNPLGYIKTTQTKVALVNHLQAVLGNGYKQGEVVQPSFGLIRCPRISAIEEEFPQYAWDDKKLMTDTVMSMGLAAMQGLREYIGAVDAGSPYGG